MVGIDLGALTTKRRPAAYTPKVALKDGSDDDDDGSDKEKPGPKEKTPVEHAKGVATRYQSKMNAALVKAKSRLESLKSKKGAKSLYDTRKEMNASLEAMNNDLQKQISGRKVSVSELKVVARQAESLLRKNADTTKKEKPWV